MSKWQRYVARNLGFLAALTMESKCFTPGRVVAFLVVTCWSTVLLVKLLGGPVSARFSDTYRIVQISFSKCFLWNRWKHLKALRYVPFEYTQSTVTIAADSVLQVMKGMTSELQPYSKEICILLLSVWAKSPVRCWGQLVWQFWVCWLFCWHLLTFLHQVRVCGSLQAEISCWRRCHSRAAQDKQVSECIG